VRGVSGAHGVGAVVCAPGVRASVRAMRLTTIPRLEGDRDLRLPPHATGFTWEVNSIAPGADVSAEARLQDLMRDAERALAEDQTGEDGADRRTLSKNVT